MNPIRNKVYLNYIWESIFSETDRNSEGNIGALCIWSAELGIDTSVNFIHWTYGSWLPFQAEKWIQWFVNSKGKQWKQMHSWIPAGA